MCKSSVAPHRRHFPPSWAINAARAFRAQITCRDGIGSAAALQERLRRSLGHTVLPKCRQPLGRHGVLVLSCISADLLALR